MNKKIILCITLGATLLLTNNLASIREHPINDDLIHKIIRVESNWNHKAVSKKGAIGLGQIMPLWVKELKKEKIIKSKKDLFNPHKNVASMRYILKKYHKESKGDMRKTLNKYSGGHKGYYERVNLP